MRGNEYAKLMSKQCVEQSVINTLQAKRFQYAYSETQIKHKYYAKQSGIKRQ